MIDQWGSGGHGGLVRQPAGGGKQTSRKHAAQHSRHAMAGMHKLTSRTRSNGVKLAVRLLRQQSSRGGKLGRLSPESGRAGDMFSTAAT